MLGPQTIFEDTQSKIVKVVELIDPAKTPDDTVKFLKDHVGFTKELDSITQGLTTDELRKLIVLAVPLWRQKGLEIGYKNIVRLFTGAGSRVFNWFDFRFIIGEKALGEEQLGEDSWLISTPGVELSQPTNNVVVLLTFEDNFKDRSLTRNDSVFIGNILQHFFQDVGAVPGSLKHLFLLDGGRIKIPRNSAYDFSGDFTIEGFFKTTELQNAVLFRTENLAGTKRIQIDLDTTSDEITYTTTTDDIIAADASSNNNDGEFENSLVPSAPGNPGITGSTRSLLGNGTTQAVRFPRIVDYDLTGNWTIEMFILRSATPGAVQTVMAKQLAGGDNRGSYRLEAGPTGLVFSMQDFISGVDDSVTIAAGSVFDSAWHHVAFTKSGTSLHYYVDGVRVAIAALSNTNPLDAAVDLLFLRDINGAQFSDVRVDEVRISNTDLYTAGTLTIPTTEFVANATSKLIAHFDETDTIIETIASGSSLTNDNWRHFALTLDKTKGALRAWLDGTEATPRIENGLRDLTTDADMFIGASNSISADFYEGDLDNFRVSLNAVYDVDGSTITPPAVNFIEFIEEQLDEFQTDIRVVDDTTLNRGLLLKVLNLMRPSSERLNVIYIRYFEDFVVGKGTLTTISGTSFVQDNTLIMPAGSIEHSDILGDTLLQDIYYQSSTKVDAGGETGVRFNIQNVNDFYRFVMSTLTSEFRLERVVAGVPTNIAGPVFGDIVASTNYVLSLTTSFNPVTNLTKIKCFQDSNLIFDVEDAAFEEGKFGIDAVGTQVTINEIELFTKPLETNRIDPNFVVS